MGMDLHSVASTIGQQFRLHYNWTGWEWLIEHLQKWGLDTEQFSFWNDGELISFEVCNAVASTLSAHIDEIDDEDRPWIESHIVAWRSSGGFRQW